MNWIEYRINEAREKQLPELDLSLSWAASRSKDSQDVLTEFPKAILELTHLTKLNLYGHSIKELPGEIYKLERLEELSLTGTKDITLPKELSLLPNLTNLRLSLTEGLRGFDFSALPNLKVLNISAVQIMFIPKGIFQLPNLTNLGLHGIPLSMLPEAVNRLSKLQVLSAGELSLRSEAENISRGAVARLARGLELKELRLSGRMPDYSVREIAELEHLEKLELIQSEINRIPEEWFKLSGLKSLTIRQYLDPDSCVIRNIDQISRFENLTELSLYETSPPDIARVLGDLKGLTSLELVGVKLKRFPTGILSLANLESLNLSDCGISNVPDAVCDMKKLQRLDLSFNNLDSLPDRLRELKELNALSLYSCSLASVPSSVRQITNLKTLVLTKNQLSHWPEEIFELRQLEYLSLSRANLNEIPELITRLRNLEQLDLSDNKITEIPSYIASLPRLKSLDVSKNPVTSPPPEIVGRGTAAVQEYFSALSASESRRLYEAKLIIVGEGEVGKSCIAQKLVDPGYDIGGDREKIDTTRGIEIKKWHVETGVAEDFTINIWDFGGQEIYHATHQFFLTKRSLYIFVWDARKEDRLGGFDYWLNVVRLLSGDSPIFIVLNKSNMRVKEIDQRGLKAKFENIVGFHKVSALTGQGMRELTSEIKNAVVRLPHVGDTWPGTWDSVRRTLEGDARNYIDYDEYLSVCREAGLQRTQADVLSTYLHDLGVILHFQDDPLLQKIVILKPEWGTNAVYAVLDTREVQNNNGRFSFRDLGRIWGRTTYPPSKHAELLQLMIRFELCFQMANSQNYIAPELLSPKPPNISWDARDNLQFEYHYDFMPAGVITRFIARSHELLDGSLYWRNGVALAWEGTRALVISDPLSKKIRIALAGDDKKGLLSVVRREMAYIHKTLNNPDVRQMLPCICDECRAGDPFFFEYQRVHRYYVKGMTEIVCDKSVEKVPIGRLLTGVFSPAELLSPLAVGPLKTEDKKVFYVENYYENAGDDMKSEQKSQAPIKSPWVSGSFYLLAAVVLITLLAAVGKVLSYWVLPVIVIGGLLLITVVGALQLRQDDRLSEKSFVTLMKLALRQMPLLGKAVKAGPIDQGQ